MTTTRSGRVIKKPERFSPVERVTDDYATDEHDTDWESDISSEISYDPDEVEEETETEDEDFIDDEDEEVKKEPHDDDNGCDYDASEGSSDSDGDGGGTEDDEK